MIVDRLICRGFLRTSRLPCSGKRGIFGAGFIKIEGAGMGTGGGK